MKVIDQPVPGFYKMKLAKDGPWVAVMISDDATMATITDTLVDALEVWPYCIPITMDDYSFRERLRAWAVQYAPDHPAAQPYRPVDVRNLKPGW